MSTDDDDNAYFTDEEGEAWKDQGSCPRPLRAPGDRGLAAPSVSYALIFPLSAAASVPGV